jgi:hypothetical protein
MCRKLGAWRHIALSLVQGCKGQRNLWQDQKGKGSDVRVKTRLTWLRIGSKGGYLNFAFLKDGNFLEQLSDHQLLENDHVSEY